MSGQDTNSFAAHREQMITEHLSLVRYIAHRIARRLPPSVEEDDLFEAGVLGLIDAIDKFDPKKKVQFKTYAEHRIRGSILDSLRALDWVPRSLRQKASLIDQASYTIAQNNGTPATSYQITEFLNIPLDSYYRLVGEFERFFPISLENTYWEDSRGDSRTLLETIPDTRQKHPATFIDRKNLRNILAKEIEKLPYKSRTVLYLYYFKEYNMKKIGKILNITESRVSQIHSQALKVLRRRLKSILEL
ncbi:FliA/WhiG family RNA polymerase sigma factor [Candidatus Sumerlaeota bacterium]|nr:FliA/WhiG family RNA polymerase sigma factor [Candidatus Sumerlaeota bacterium]